MMLEHWRDARWAIHAEPSTDPRTLGNVYEVKEGSAYRVGWALGRWAVHYWPDEDGEDSGLTFGIDEIVTGRRVGFVSTWELARELCEQLHSASAVFDPDAPLDESARELLAPIAQPAREWWSCG